MSHRWSTLRSLLLLVLFCRGFGSAEAQIPGFGSSKDAPTMRLRPAFESSTNNRFLTYVPADRWLPMMLEIGPGDAGGIISIEFLQDASQRARIITPFAATPGRTTFVPVLLPLPDSPGEIELRMSAANSARQTFSSVETLAGMGSSSSSTLIPVWPRAGTLLMLWCGPSSLERTLFGSGSLVGGATQNALTIAEILPENLPRVSMGYDACRVLIVRPGSAAAASESTRSAIADWVESGGHLILLCEDGGSAWRQWLPRSAQSSFDLLDPRSVDFGGPLAGVSVRDRSLPVRAIRIEPEGAARGWLPVLGSGENVVVARGAAGLGLITVMGADPASLAPPLDDSLGEDDPNLPALEELWRICLRGPLGDMADARADSNSRSFDRRSRATFLSSGADHMQQESVASTLDRLAQAPPTSNTLFWIIGGGLLLLALLLGPGDYLLLRKLERRQYWWLTSLIWITLASIFAVLMPRVVRSAESQWTSSRTLDLVVDDQSAPARGWHTSFYGLFCGEPMSPRLEDDSPRQWWCGVSGMPSRGVRASLKPFTTVQANGECAPPEDPNVSAMPMGLWMFRTVMSRGPVPSQVKVSLTRAIDEWDLRIEGLPESASSGVLLVRFAQECSRQLETSIQDGSLAVTIPVSSLTSAMNGGIEDVFLPGVQERTEAMRRCVAAGTWALVELSFEAPEAPVGIRPEMVQSHSEHLRLLVRLDLADRMNDGGGR